MLLKVMLAVSFALPKRGPHAIEARSIPSALAAGVRRNIFAPSGCFGDNSTGDDSMHFRGVVLCSLILDPLRGVNTRSKTVPAEESEEF